MTKSQLAITLIPILRCFGLILSYRKRLEWVVLFSLEHRRVKGDLIEVYEIMRGMKKVNAHRPFTIEDSKTSGHWVKVERKRF